MTNSKGESVPQAVVSVQATHQGNIGRGSPPEGTDPIAVTDDEGQFALYSKEPFDHMTLKVEARALAPLRFNEVRPGPTRRTLMVTEGAALRGRVLLNGKPLKDVAIGAVSVDRSENFSGDYEYASNEEGVFYFPNLPPNRPYYVYGMMGSLMKYGAIPAKKVELKGDGTTADVGDLEVVPGFRLAGEVRLSDGKSLPAPTRLSIGRREAWDVHAVELTPDGRFDVTNVPPESISVGARIKDYRHSGRNKSLDRLNPFGLEGRLTRDKTNLVILLEPGPMLESEWNDEPESERAENLPLAGIEDGGLVENTVHGRILDAATGEPIKRKAQVTPGYSRDGGNRFIQWQNNRSVTTESGVYALSIPQSRKEVMIQVRAEDYAPHLSKPVLISSTNQEYEVTLSPAKSPSAVVLGLDGKPAAGVKVHLLGPMEQGSFNKNGELNVHRVDAESICVTDAEGRFKFTPKAGEAEIFAATRDGFARVAVKELPETIALQPYGRIRGRLLKGGQPVVEEMVDLGWERQFQANAPYINLHGSVTDEDGNFEIANVPPGNLRVTRRDRMHGGSGWTSIEITKFQTRPGELLELGKLEYPSGRVSRR